MQKQNTSITNEYNITFNHPVIRNEDEARKLMQKVFDENIEKTKRNMRKL